MRTKRRVGSWLGMLILLAWGNLSAETVYDQPATIFQRITTPEAKFYNPYCITFHIRASRWHDIKVAAGYTISKITVQDERQPDDEVGYTKVTLEYADANRNLGKPFEFQCKLLGH